jgi:SAM-dependent methyltransferase
MVMDDAIGVAEYDHAGATLLVPLHQFSARALSRLLPEGGVLLDLGCGSGRLLSRLALGRPDAHFVGLDLSEPMLRLGRHLLAHEGLVDRVDLRTGDITNFDAELPEQLSVVGCNLALHHLPGADQAASCLEAIRRARERTGCGVYIFDFARLRNTRTWPAMMSLASAPGRTFLRDAIASERAAFTFGELTTLIAQTGLQDLRHARAGPVGEYQLHWVAGRDVGPAGRWHEVPLPHRTRLVTRLIHRSFPPELTSL